MEMIKSSRMKSSASTLLAVLVAMSVVVGFVSVGPGSPGPVGVVEAANWDVSDTEFDQELDVSGQEAGPAGVVWKPDGTRFYIVGGSDDEVNEYTVSTAWNISTATHVRNFALNGDNVAGLAWNDDGTKFFMVDEFSDNVVEYSASNPYNISSLSQTNVVDISTETTNPSGMAFNDDGSKVLIPQDHNSFTDIDEYSLSTPYDTATMSFADNRSFGSETSTEITGVDWGDSGSKLYVSDAKGSSDGAIYQYSASVPYSLDSVSYDGVSKTITRGGDPEDVTWNDTGDIMWVVELTGTDGVQEYSIPSSTTSSTSTGSSSEPAQEGFDQDFELTSTTDEFPSEFNPQTAEIATFYLLNDSGGRATVISDRDEDVTVTTTGIEYVSDSWEQEDSDEFNFNNIATLRHHDNTAYEGWLQGDGAIKKVLFESYPDRGTIVIELVGPEGDPDFPNPGELDIPDLDRINIGDTDGDGIIDTRPPLENPQFEVNQSDAYLQTGVFLFDGEPCAGLRYYDPSGTTTDFSYDFSVSGETYASTLTFDEPVSYYEECLETQTIDGIDDSADDLPSNGSDIPEFDFTAFTNGSEIGGSVGLGGSGSSVGATGIFGETVGGDSGGVVGPASSSGGGGFPWLWVIVGLIVGGYLLRDEVMPVVTEVVGGARSTIRSIFR